MMLGVLFIAAFAAVARVNDVLKYTDDDFEIGDHDFILVEFFAPCMYYKYCKNDVCVYTQLL
uniref:Uncharacterized protein n=1 Tax=Cyprinus carpio TaxID=7962 RepID=A0A8C1LJM6_CYPCA